MSSTSASDEGNVDQNQGIIPEPQTSENADHQTIHIASGLTPDDTILSAGYRFQYLHMCLPLYQAALQGNWKDAKDVLDRYPNAIRIAITENKETALHIAAAAKRTSFVKELVKRMEKEDLALINKDGDPAIFFAAISGVVKIAETMVNKNENLPMIRGSERVIPLYFAVKLRHKKMVSYLYKVTELEKMTSKENEQLFFACISTDTYDVPLGILKKGLTLATTRNSNKEKDQTTATDGNSNKETESQDTTLHVLGSMGRFISSWICKKGTKALAQELAQKLWLQVVDLPESEMSKLIEWPSNLLLDAAEIGNVGFLTLLLRSYPDLLWKVDDKRGTIFHVAIVQRQESVYSLIHDIGAFKDLVASILVENKTKENDENNSMPSNQNKEQKKSMLLLAKKKKSMLHLAAELPPISRLNIVSGAALQMQRELLWFQEVQKIVPDVVLSLKDVNHEIPREQFTKNHQELMKEGEKWMKDTATSCMVVATLIATMVFTVAFTVPGGNNSETGRPVLLKEQWLVVFILSDVVGLFSSVISIVMFLSILTSRFAEKDFLVSLPAKLIVGLAALFLSIGSMLLAFVATFFLVYDYVTSLAPILVASFAYLVAICHIMLHLRVWIDTVRSTFFSRFVFKNCRNMLF